MTFHWLTSISSAVCNLFYTRINASQGTTNESHMKSTGSPNLKTQCGVCDQSTEASESDDEDTSGFTRVQIVAKQRNEKPTYEKSKLQEKTDDWIKGVIDVPESLYPYSSLYSSSPRSSKYCPCSGYVNVDKQRCRRCNWYLPYNNALKHIRSREGYCMTGMPPRSEWESKATGARRMEAHVLTKYYY